MTPPSLEDNMKPTVSLAIIAKDEDQALCRIIDKYNKYFDEIHIAYDGIYEQLETLLMSNFDHLMDDKVFVHQYSWRNDFAHKRNFLSSKITTDYYVRMDTDDELEGLDNLRNILDKMKDTNTDAVLCNYRYHTNATGQTELAHNRETIIRNDPKLYWKGRIHECIVCDDATNIRIYIDQDKMLEVIHTADRSHRYVSIERNLIILEDEYAKKGEATDPRYIAYLGRSYCEIDRPEESLQLLELHIKKSGWDEDRYISRLYLATAYTKMGMLDTAIENLLKAIKERPDYSMAYGQLCEVYYESNNYKNAIEYGLICLSKGQPKTNMGYDPSLITWKIPLYLALSYYQLNDVEKAIEYFAAAKKIAPNEQDIIDLGPTFIKTAIHYDYMKHLVKVLSITKKMGGDVASLVKSIPLELHGHEMIQDLQHHYLPSNKWDEKSVVIYCGNTPHMWSPEDVKTGIGGSEEAIIYLGRELIKLGHQVTVYSNIAEPYNDHGVDYLPYVQFNRNDKFANLIGWRQNMAIYGLEATNHVMWIHDMPRKELLSEERLEGVNSVIVLSEYHKTLLPDHVKDHCKIIVSTNGINPEDFKGIDVPRQPKRIIYASSYDRGLEIIVENWPKIRAAEPDAELHIYYGWNTYDEYVAMGLTTPEFKDKMIKLFEQPGIYEHGRIGHRELNEEYMKASLFAYPCTYSGEINCIALTKAIATGCNIVTNDYAVLSERSPNAVTNEQFIDETIKALKLTANGKRDEYIEEMSWANVAVQWKEEVLNG
jgi:tetratricopeptide (TPR) repeat protein